MLIEYNGDFYGVGQGLFACGSINITNDSSVSLNYIYDCGTETSQQLLKNHIEAAVNRFPNRPLDLLFLSHVHKDHVSGLPYLLEKLKTRKGVKKVILPYLYPAERAVVLGKAFDDPGISRSPDDWYIEFLTSPAAFLLERGVQEVYFVRGGDGIEPISIAEFMPHGPNKEDQVSIESEDASLPIKIKPHRNKKNIDRCKLLEKIVEGDSPHALDNIISSRSIIDAAYWFFVLFNKDVEEELGKFYAEFDDIRGGRSLADILKDCQLIQRIQTAYKQLVGQNKLNDSSLAVLSACEMAYIRRAKRICFYAFRDPYWPFCCIPPIASSCFFDESVYRKIWYDAGCLGIIYTGDLPVADLWQSISQKFGIDKHQGTKTIALTYQIPHHGSIENWHRSQAEIEASPSYVLSAGTKNRHGHPSASVLRDISECNRKLMWVHEHRSFPHRLQIKI